MGEGGVDVCGEGGVVDIVLVDCLGGAQWQAGPDDGLGIDGRDEEGGLARGDVIGVVAVGQVAAGQIVEVSALPIGVKLGHAVEQERGG